MLYLLPSFNAVTVGVAAVAAVTVAPPLLAASGIFDCYAERRRLRDRPTRAARRLARGVTCVPMALPVEQAPELAADTLTTPAAASPGTVLVSDDSADGPTEARDIRMADAIREAVRVYKERRLARLIPHEALKRTEEGLSPYICDQSDEIPIEPVRSVPWGLFNVKSLIIF